MEIRHEDYHPYRNRFHIPVWDNKEFYRLDLPLDPLFKLPVYAADLTEKGGHPSSRAYSSELRHEIMFDFDKAELKAEMEEKLDLFLETVLSGKPVQNVEIIGYADDIGGDQYNLLLSEQRAKAIGVYLKEKGVRVDKIYIEGKGETDGGKPKWQNRRVEVVVYLAQ
jgi:outer membrane protein OmpA-like peptidoglycan-associated protein